MKAKPLVKRVVRIEKKIAKHFCAETTYSSKLPNQSMLLFSFRRQCFTKRGQPIVGRRMSARGTYKLFDPETGRTTNL